MRSEIKSVEDYKKAEYIKIEQLDDFDEPIRSLDQPKDDLPDNVIQKMIDEFHEKGFKLFAYSKPNFVISDQDDKFFINLFQECCDLYEFNKDYPIDFMRDCIKQIKARFML